MKQFYFLCGLPRAGNTLLASLINQNKNVTITANSILADILFDIYKLYNHEIFLNFPDKKSLQNVSKNVFNNYYSDWKANIIIDRSTWGTPMNLFILKEIFKNLKFIILYRPVLECLASFVKLVKPDDIQNYCDQIMSEEGIIGKNLWSIKNIINSKEKYQIVHYDNLILNPEKEIKNIFNFLNIKYQKLKLKNIKQFKINDIKYNDKIIGIPNLHKIKTKNITKSKYDIKKILPEEIIKKYEFLDLKI